VVAGTGAPGSLSGSALGVGVDSELEVAAGVGFAEVAEVAPEQAATTNAATAIARSDLTRRRA